MRVILFIANAVFLGVNLHFYITTGNPLSLIAAVVSAVAVLALVVTLG